MLLVPYMHHRPYPLDHRTGVANITRLSRGIIANHHSLEPNYLLQGDSIQSPFHGIVTTACQTAPNAKCLLLLYIYYPVDPTTNIKKKTFPILASK